MIGELGPDSVVPLPDLPSHPARSRVASAGQSVAMDEVGSDHVEPSPSFSLSLYSSHSASSILNVISSTGGGKVEVIHDEIPLLVRYWSLHPIRVPLLTV